VFADGIRIKKESSTSICLSQEVGGKSRDPLEDRESSTGFEHEKRDSLLKKKADDDGRPNMKGQCCLIAFFEQKDCTMERLFAWKKTARNRIEKQRGQEPRLHGHRKLYSEIILVSGCPSSEIQGSTSNLLQRESKRRSKHDAKET
jgi:hypothetical protein